MVLRHAESVWIKKGYSNIYINQAIILRVDLKRFCNEKSMGG